MLSAPPTMRPASLLEFHQHSHDIHVRRSEVVVKHDVLWTARFFVSEMLAGGQLAQGKVAIFAR
jgi:hypothetical protein